MLRKHKQNIAAILLAAGKGTRMGGSIPKCLLNIGEKPIIYWTLSVLSNIGLKNIIVVTGYKKNLIKKAIKKMGFDVKIVADKLLGTGRAAASGLKKVSSSVKNVLVLYGDDSGLYEAETIKSFLKFHLEGTSRMSVLVFKSKELTDLGSLEEDDKENLIGVLSKSQVVKKKVSESLILCGALCFDRDWLVKSINLIKKSPGSGEYPLPQLINIAANEGSYAKAFYLEHPNEWNSVNTKKELREARAKKVENLKNEYRA